MATVVPDTPDTGVLAGDLVALVRELLDAEVHADEVRDVVERAVRDWTGAG